MHWPFQVHRLYNRRQHIHAIYGGQRQDGIVTPRDVPGIFVFTGHGARTVGYSDRWEEDGSLRYTGRGQTGDMEMTAGNKAIRDHISNGKDLLVFDKAGSGQPVRFLGLFYCAGWETEQQPDRNGADREAIVFKLVPAAGIETVMHDTTAVDPDAALPLDTLRARALAAASSDQNPSQATNNVYKRSRDVRNYVLARAAGTCEGCDNPAPFNTKKGILYLEPHHIRRISDGGPDHPKFVAGVCPNCHRRAHYGEDARTFNENLLNRVANLEGSGGED